MNITKSLPQIVLLSLALLAPSTLIGCGRPSDDSMTRAALDRQKPLPKCREPKSGGPEQVVHLLYRDYPALGNRTIADEPRDVLAKYFDAKATRLLLKIRECERRTGDECYGGSDIMYDAQDFDILEFQVCTMDTATNTVTVQFRNMGNPKHVFYHLSNTHVGWRISDISYPADAEGSSRYSLIESLSRDY